jgi:hypothetical protein
MHNINIMHFPDEIIRTNKQTGQIVLLRNIVRGPIEPTVTQLESWAVSDNGASEAFNMYEANDIWMQHGSDPRVNTCRRRIWLRRVGMFPDYKIAYSKDSECTELLDVFPLQMLYMSSIHFLQSSYMQPSRRSIYTKNAWALSTLPGEIGEAQAMMEMVRYKYINKIWINSAQIL